MYNYNAKIIRWVDGDTFEAEVDLGFFVTYRSMFRVFGIDTPEITGVTKEAGLAAKAYAVKLAPPGSFVPITTYKPDKYGRWLASLSVKTEVGVEDFATVMLKFGQAVPMQG